MRIKKLKSDTYRIATTKQAGDLVRKTRLVKNWTVFLALILLTTCFCSTAEAASFKVKINSSSAQVYKSPSSSSAHVSGVKGTTLNCTGYSGGWACVKYKGQTAYMKIKDLNLADRVKVYAKSSTSVYKSASSSAKIGTLAAGSAVYAIGYSNGYVRVQNSSGSVTGYVKLSQVSKDSSYKGLSNSNSSKLTVLLNTAKAQLGKPYGYSTPTTFNCSSLVRYCYGKIGYSLKSTAAKQSVDNRMAKITKISSLKPGDVICFDCDEDGTCDHVGMFLKGNSYIEASHGAGKVRINEFDSYYRRVFMWARRVK